VIGQLAKQPRYQGGGSSHIKPTKLEDISEELTKSAGSSAEIAYAQGYELNGDQTNLQLLKEAVKLAEDASVVILFVGLPERYESEGFDREHLNLPANQSELIEAVTAVQKRTVLVLSNGAPVVMPWIGSVKAVLEAYLGGQALGGAIADLLFGDANPCGKLAETFPIQLSDNPSYLNFPGDGDLVAYKEGIYVGYRYYDKKKLRPLFPFGHGLSYTTFEYSGLVLDKNVMNDTEILNATVSIKNVGNRAGKEIVQLYVRDVASNVTRPEKELKGFIKVALNPGEEKTVTFTLEKRSFAYFNTELNDWHVETGEFDILIGKSSSDILLKGALLVNSTVPITKTYTRNSTVGDLMENPQAAATVTDLLKHSPFAASSDGEEGMSELMAAFLKYLPLRGLASFSRGSLTEEALDSLLVRLNEKK
ncbi:glycoside hydrolase family 3 C-terminal domain-containing protein, partial [Paenibacillus sp. TAF58]